jgi:hypothetical protein
VPKAGLEPACLATHAPETCVSTNFTTSAKKNALIPKNGAGAKVRKKADKKRWTRVRGASLYLGTNI